MKEPLAWVVIGLIVVILAMIAERFMLTRLFVQSLDVQNGIYQMSALTNMREKK